MPALSLVHTGWPMPTLVTVSMSLPRRKVADAQLEPLRAVIIGERREQLAVGADLERAKPEIFAALGFGRLVEQDLVVAARRPACDTRSGTAPPA